MSVDGTTLSLALNAATNTSLYEGSEVYITTDAAGVPVLELTGVDVDSRVQFSLPNTDVLQLGTRDPVSGPTEYFNRIEGSVGSLGLVSNIQGALVPEPTTALLLGLGLVGLSYRLRSTALESFTGSNPPA